METRENRGGELGFGAGQSSTSFNAALSIFSWDFPSLTRLATFRHLS